MEIWEFVLNLSNFGNCEIIFGKLNNRNQEYCSPFSSSACAFFPIPFSLSHRQLPSQRFNFYTWCLSYVVTDDYPTFSALDNLHRHQSCVAANYSSTVNTLDLLKKLHDYSVLFANASVASFGITISRTSNLSLATTDYTHPSANTAHQQRTSPPFLPTNSVCSTLAHYYSTGFHLLP